VALSNAVFAGSAKEQQIDGTVVQCNDHALTIEDSKKEEHTFRNGFRTQHYKPEVGDKVTVHWAIGLHGAPWADKVDKIEKGSKKD
jgi:hypothetical protein